MLSVPSGNLSHFDGWYVKWRGKCFTSHRANSSVPGAAITLKDFVGCASTAVVCSDADARRSDGAASAMRRAVSENCVRCAGSASSEAGGASADGAFSAVTVKVSTSGTVATPA